jgi:hypothetical protein
MLCKSHFRLGFGTGSDPAGQEKRKMRFCDFIHFSIADAIEKWRHVPVSQESPHDAESFLASPAGGRAYFKVTQEETLKCLN